MNITMDMGLPESFPPLETAAAVSRLGMCLREAPGRNCIMIGEFASNASDRLRKAVGLGMADCAPASMSPRIWPMT